MVRATTRWALLLALLTPSLGGCGSPPTRVGRRGSIESSPPGSHPIAYEVTVDPSLSTLRARVCFEGEPPAALSAMDRAIVPAIQWARGPEARALARTVRGVLLDGVGPGECVEYGVDLREAERRSRRAARTGGDLLIPQAGWLLRPSAPPRSGRLAFHLPDGVRVATPWPRASAGGFELDESAFVQSAPVAFGAFEQRTVSAAGARFAIARLEGELDRVDGPVLDRGIATAARAVGQVLGRFPVDAVRVYVLPVGPGDRPVAFGHVTRGGGIAILLLVHGNADPDAFVADWTATHELAHLLLPRVQRDAAWLGEGIVTYYQEVLRARVGAQRPEDAWRRLCEGFARGRLVGTGRTLPEEAAAMHATGAYWRVYWSGAAFALEADLSLRARGGESLDDAVARVQPSRGIRRRPWPGRALLRALDGEGPAVIAPIARRYAALRAFPDLDGVLRSLGVRCGDGAVHLDDAAPMATVRDAIMRAGPSPGSSR